MPRNVKVVIMTDGDVKEKLQVYAEKMGLTVSALGAYILGNWVYQQENVIGPLLDKMGNAMIPIVKGDS